MRRDDPFPSSDAALEDAIGAFLDWARAEGVEEHIPDLPDAEEVQRRVNGARFGDFRLVRRLAAGGGGIVYEARQLSLGGRRVALKFLRHLFASRRAAQRFQREIETIARLDHAAIVPIVHADVEGGVPFYAMKYVDGMSADRLVLRLREREELPASAADVARALGEDAAPGDARWSGSYVRWVARVGLHLAEALQHAHERGVVHRDVKPANVMLDRGGGPVLVDFGLALGAGDPTLTDSQRFLGTMPYASPEQLTGSRLDTRTDVFSLGVTLYELVSLRRPFSAASPTELTWQIEREDPPPLDRRVPRDLRTILERALEKQRERRYPTPGAMASDLRAFLAGEPIEARPRGPWERARLAVRRHPRAAAVLTVVAVLLGGLRVRDHLSAGSFVRDARVGLEAVLALERQEAGLLERHAALFEQSHPQRTVPDPARVAQLREDYEELRGELASAADGVEAAARRAFDFVAGHSGARSVLADLAAEELRRALRECRDLTDAQAFEALQRRLETEDTRGRHAALLDARGDLRLDCATPGAELVLYRLAEGARIQVAQGVTPLALEDLPEGLYQVELSAADHVDATCPVLLRRAAADLDDRAAGRRRLRFTLLEPDELVDGFRHVPDGWTLVEDDPPRWALVEGFQMMEREVTYGEWMRWLTDPRLYIELATTRWSSATRFRPRDADAQVHVELISLGLLGWAWSFVPGWELTPDLPVRGLTCFEMGAYQSCLPTIEGWAYDLPRVQEWIRAARGADGRRFPWGDRFQPGRCACYSRELGRSYEPEPRPVRSHPGDRSPFDIFDLAGSVAEATSKPFGVVPGTFAFCGGSFLDADPAALRTTSVRAGRNVPYEERGFRLVLRRDPAWTRVAAPDEDALEQDFEGLPAGADPSPWLEFVGDMLDVRDAQDRSAGVRIEDGCLVLQGGEGHFSRSCTALRRIRRPDRPYVVRAVLRMGWKRVQSPDMDDRGIKLLVHSGRPAWRDDFAQAAISLSVSGGVELSVLGDPVSTADERVDPRERLALELRTDTTGTELRVWPAGTERPLEPLLRSSRAFLAPRFLGFQASNLVGATLRVDSVELAPLPVAGGLSDAEVATVR